MAEALGVVASAISLLTLLEHIIGSIEKLNGLRVFVRTIPHELEDLMEEIGLVQCVLKTLSPDMFHFLDIALVERRLRTFENDLGVIIREVEKHRIIASRRIGAMKLALKKEELKTMRRNLDNVKSTLQLLQFAYCSVSLRELRPMMGSKMLMYSDDEKLSDEDLEMPNRKQIGAMQRRKNRRLHHGQLKETENEWEVRFRTPLVILDRLWAFRFKRSVSGWTFSLQTNNVVPSEAPILDACYNVDINEVQRLFTANLASPNDCNEHGMSLLQFAVMGAHVEICLLLLDNGADADHRDNYGFPVLHRAGWKLQRFPDTPGIADSTIQLYRLALRFSKSHDDPFSVFMRKSITWDYGFSGPSDALALLQQHVYGEYNDLPITTRFHRAMSLSTEDITPLKLRIAMGGSIEPEAYHLEEEEEGQTLLLRIAESIAVELAHGETDCTQTWRPLIVDAVSASANLHKISWTNTGIGTVLQWFLKILAFNWQCLRKWQYDFTPFIRVWVTELKSAGVDLEAYGAKEQLLYDTGDLDLELWTYVGSLGEPQSASWFLEHKQDYVPFRVLKLVYGPEPEDWRLWTTNPIDELVGEFWEMIEMEEEVMPGAWVD
ncbi:hypothetical protein BDW69DRAFT_107821 [Aspergillus filifer]